MMNSVTVHANQAVQNITENINSISQGFTQARREFRDRPLNPKVIGGRIVDVGARVGALAATGERFVAKYIVGRGCKATDTLPVSMHMALKQHGVIGVGLQLLTQKLGTLCHIAPEHNLGLRFADAAMAGLRFVVIGLVEASLVAFGYLVFAAIQIVADGVLGGYVAGKKTLNKIADAHAVKAMAKHSLSQMPETVLKENLS